MIPSTCCRTLLRACGALAALALANFWAAVPAPAQPYPVRPVRIVVPLSAGGGVDSLARLIGQHYNALWGQPFIVDNRPGAGGSIGIEIVARAPPDGYTLLVSSSTLVTNAAVRESRYDPVRDFQAVSRLTANPYIVVTAPGLPVASVRDLIALAKAKPGALTFASAGAGSVLHLGGELFCALSGTQMTHVPYKGVAEGYPAVASGQISWILGSPISALPLIKAGRLKAIAVTSLTRSKWLPDLPTVAESGVPGYEVNAWFGLFAPAGTPPAVVERLYAEAARALRDPEVVRRMEVEATEVIGNTPREFAPEVRREFDKWRTLVRQVGLKL